MIGQKRPLKPKEVWAIRLRLQLEGQKRDLALFNLTIDSKLRGCDLGRPVQFEITDHTRSSIRDWLSEVALGNSRYLFPSRFRTQPHLSTRQYTPE
jgi:hypothetical protein